MSDHELPEPDIKVGAPKTFAVGLPGIQHSMEHALGQMGGVRTAKVLLSINQPGGFDCPSCAWPDPKHGHRAEFCENGAKAAAWEATRKRVGRHFFATYSIAQLRTQTDHWLEKQGRLTEPMYLAPGAEHYVPVSWEAAFALTAEQLKAMPDPNRAAFYTSGRASNEAAFLYQLLARRLGTNNLPDCSNMCHESSGAALNETLGIGKGTVTLEDLSDHSDLIIVVGQNPGTNHPRMLSALEQAKRRGARIIGINPLPEAGLIRFKNPQRPRGIVGRGTQLADRLILVRVNGDLALFAGINKALLERDAEHPGILDTAFINEHTDGFSDFVDATRSLEWDVVEELSGIAKGDIEQLADDVIGADSVIVCWAMGLTQHRNAVTTIREVVNFLLLRGNVGRPGAGACPVRGHSNVQGDRTMGVWEKMPDEFLDALQSEFRFDPPRDHGLDTVDTIRAMRDGRIDVFMALGGNFVSASPDTDVTAAAMENCALTVHVATKLNRSHLHHGREALILPCLGRTERDITTAGEQVITVEDSMGMVHASRGRLLPGSPALRSETSIVAGLADALFGTDIGWAQMGADYTLIRSSIERVIPGFAKFETRIKQAGGFALPNGPRDARQFATATGKARFTVNPPSAVSAPPGHLLLQTVRSHDQFNTTVYGLSDRYRGIKGGRRVVFVNVDDLRDSGLRDGDVIDIVSVWVDGERRAEAFRIVEYPTPRGCAATYFPEANVLVPLDSTAEESNTPTSKSVVVRLESRPVLARPRTAATEAV
ncbi:FdhF/YdeP family oxidoreductase [Nocardioides sp. LS1]|uniref:FdhF/YdeP family oxidoreductase n=1 Tax=Nocardioides sp. LS1 TaxID=1027620 RepID=UPI000F623B88|nr:FdhF/YdeP family oxidoreductase [Nocardioides sp. LS1]GCD88104.1 formate dehydrogenase subunit alpha [Nocardioides sp. LS1]